MIAQSSNFRYISEAQVNIPQGKFPIASDSSSHMELAGNSPQAAFGSIKETNLASIRTFPKSCSGDKYISYSFSFLWANVRFLMVPTYLVEHVLMILDSTSRLTL